MHQSMKYPVSTGIYWPLWNWLVQIIIPPTLKYIMMHRRILPSTEKIFRWKEEKVDGQYSKTLREMEQ